MEHSPLFLKLVAEVRSRVQEITVEDVQKRLAKGDPLTFVDVREESEWAQGHVPGAVHLGKGVIERDVEGRFPDLNAEIILYCGGGYRSALAADNLQKMGYSRVISMDGGFRAWKDSGGAVTQK